jgi:hypothetical protein
MVVYIIYEISHRKLMWTTRTVKGGLYKNLQVIRSTHDNKGYRELAAAHCEVDVSLPRVDIVDRHELTNIYSPSVESTGSEYQVLGEYREEPTVAQELK